jgi:hypothetical protein
VPGQVLPRNFGLQATAPQPDFRSPIPASRPQASPRSYSHQNHTQTLLPAKTEEFNPYDQLPLAPHLQSRPQPSAQHQQLPPKPRLDAPPIPAALNDADSVIDISDAYDGIEIDDPPPPPAQPVQNVTMQRPIPRPLQTGGPSRSDAAIAQQNRQVPAALMIAGGMRSKSVPPEPEHKQPAWYPPPVTNSGHEGASGGQLQGPVSVQQRMVQNQQYQHHQSPSPHHLQRQEYTDRDQRFGMDARSPPSTRAPSVQWSLTSSTRSGAPHHPHRGPQNLVMPAPLQQSQYTNSQQAGSVPHQKRQSQLPPQFNTHYKPSAPIPPPIRHHQPPTPVPQPRFDDDSKHKLLRKRTTGGKSSDMFAPPPSSFHPPPPQRQNPWAEPNPSPAVYTSKYPPPNQTGVARSHTTSTPTGKTPKKVLSKRRSHL